MSDVNTFIDTIGKDINATVSPQIERLAPRGDNLAIFLPETAHERAADHAAMAGHPYPLAI